ncbi:MAG: SprT family zinc-dependent metalloprotease [Smithella sp.]
MRSKRKTIALVVTSDAQIIVRAPNETSLEYIEWLIEKKKMWLKQKLSHVKKLNETHKKKKYLDGEGFLYLGKWQRLNIIKNQNVPLRHAGDLLLINESDLPNAKKLIDDWYKERCDEIIRGRVNWFVKCYGFNYSKIKITEAQKRWGSCGQSNTLNFSWHLVTAPMEVIDYVVAHELCHTVEKDHSEKFWIKMITIMPYYKKAMKWLEQNQRLMDV